MTGDLVAGMIAGVMCLVLVGSSLIARRLPMRTTLRLALIWLTIFAGLYAIVTIFGGFESDGSGSQTDTPARHDLT